MTRVVSIFASWIIGSSRAWSSSRGHAGWNVGSTAKHRTYRIGEAAELGAMVALCGALQSGDGVHDVEALSKRVDVEFLEVVEVEFQKDGA